MIPRLFSTSFIILLLSEALQALCQQGITILCNYSVHHRGLSLSKTGNNISIPAQQIHWESSYLCIGK